MNELQLALTDRGANSRSVLGQWSNGKLAQMNRAHPHRIVRSLRAGVVKSLGALRLIVLSSGLKVSEDQDWQRMQTELLELSSTSQQLFADNSGHNIQIDQPEAAVGAIERMVEQTRQQASLAAR